MSVCRFLPLELAIPRGGADERNSNHSAIGPRRSRRSLSDIPPRPPEWISAARRALGRLKSPGGAWGYRDGGEPSVEPTVLAGLGLLGTDRDGESLPAVREAAEWIAGRQRSDGSLGATSAADSPEWPTPLAMLLWQAVGGHDANRERAAAWLLKRKGEVFPPEPGQPAGHDTSIQGWPWVAETHPWLEPTAMAVLVLRVEWFGEHPRVRDGLRLIRDRAIPSGGWNYGNSIAFGTPLRPQPAPTGLGLLALAGAEPKTSRIVEEACVYLEETLPRTRSPQALCWGLWGLEAWGRRPADAAGWLAEAYRLVDGRPDPILQLGYLLMASAPLPSDLAALTKE